MGEERKMQHGSKKKAGGGSGAGEAKEKGFLGKMGDKISAGLFKASKMNKNAFNKK